jgi:hypothetical protein
MKQANLYHLVLLENGKYWGSIVKASDYGFETESQPSFEV